MPKPKRSSKPVASALKNAVSKSSQKTVLQTALPAWLQAVHDWYPHLHTRTYFLPPLHFNRVPSDVAVIAGQSVLVPRPASSLPLHGPTASYPAQPRQVQLPGLSVAGSMWPQQPPTPAPTTRVLESDVKDDAATERFLHCLRVLAEEQKDVMMVISELDFRKYLDDQTNPINVAACLLLPRPADMAQHYRRGDFDVLIIHRHYGLIVAEVKSVGADLHSIKDLDKAIVTRVEKAVKQLSKAQVVLCHLVSDMPDPINITKTLILPNIMSCQLQQALGTNTTVSKDLCQCLNAQNLSEAASRCLCADQMPIAEDLHFIASTRHLARWARLRRAVESGYLRRLRSRALSSSTVTSQLAAWWKHTVIDAGPDPRMTDDRYEQLLARFCGPATTVDIPTVTAPRKVVRSQGEAVAEAGLMVSSLALYPEQVDLLNKNLDSVYLWAPPSCGKTVILVLKAVQWCNQGKSVHLISISTHSRAVSTLTEQQICQSLGAASAAGAVHRHDFDFWMNRKDVTAAINKLASLSQSCGGELHIIVDEMEQFVSTQFVKFCKQLHARVPALFVWAAGVYIPKSLPPWLSLERLSVPLRCPPSVQREVEQSKAIDGRGILLYSSKPVPSVTDGPAVMWLTHRDQAGHTKGDPQGCQMCGRNVASVLRDLGVGVSGQSSLQWRDVFILGDGLSGASPLVQELTRRGVPVKVLGTGSAPQSDIRHMALALSDHVTVTESRAVSGLERRVIVGMGAVGFWGHRMCAASRCTSQLVWIDQIGTDSIN